jgi:RNA polymerase sigma factor (sigma-70 family)
MGRVRDQEVAGLVRRAARGEEAAFEALVGRFADVVWSVARGHGLSPVDAADISQTTWLRLAEHLDTLREPARVGAWLVTTARRECLRTLQRSNHHVLMDTCLDWCNPRNEIELDHEMLEDEQDEELWRAFEALSGPCKALLRMLMADPAPSYADVSEAFDMPIGSIGPTRARCIDRLRVCVGEPVDRRDRVARNSAGTRRRAS